MLRENLKEIVEIKNTIGTVKNACMVSSVNLRQPREKKINKLKDKTTETFQTKVQRKILIIMTKQNKLIKKWGIISKDVIHE